MIFAIFVWLLTFHLGGTVLNRHQEQKCQFQDTVNLTNQPSYENGSYLYQDIFIPPEKQNFYDYDVKFLGVKISVPWHRRGCVCEKRPCMKLCCREYELFDDTQNTSKCEKLRPDMNVSWNLPIGLANSKTKLVNIFEHFTTQLGLPCQEPEALDIKLDEWLLLEDGSLLVESDDSLLGTLDYCYSPRLDKNIELYVLTPFSCPMKNDSSWQLLLNTYAMAGSVLFLIPTIVVYLVLKELRGNLRGKLLICYLLSLTMGYAIISFINISGLRFKFITCSLLGFTCYFFFMAAFLWLSVLCYDIWKNFKETNVELNSRKNRKQFIIYSLYAWLSAALATACLIYTQFSPEVNELYKPGIGVQMCWLDTNKWSASLYFYGPNLIILLFNFVTFAHLTARIYNVRRDLAKMTHKEKFFQENAIVILRLFLIMGISWLFDIISYCVRNYREWDFLFVLSDFANAIQGILIFSLFVLKPNVMNLLKKRLHRQQSGKAHRSVSSTNTNFSKLLTPTSVPALTPTNEFHVIDL